jgi:hypothetical protein
LAGIRPKLRPSDSLPPMTTRRPTAQTEAEIASLTSGVILAGATRDAAIVDHRRAAEHRQHDDERLARQQQQPRQPARFEEVRAEADRHEREEPDDDQPCDAVGVIALLRLDGAACWQSPVDRDPERTSGADAGVSGFCDSHDLHRSLPWDSASSTK